MEYELINGYKCYVTKPAVFRGTAMARIKKSQDCCPNCSQLFEDEEELSILINNGKLFPNKCIHTSCLRADGLLNIGSLLARSYQAFLDDKDAFKKRNWRWTEEIKNTHYSYNQEDRW